MLSRRSTYAEQLSVTFVVYTSRRWSFSPDKLGPALQPVRVHEKPAFSAWIDASTARCGDSTSKHPGQHGSRNETRGTHKLVTSNNSHTLSLVNSHHEPSQYICSYTFPTLQRSAITRRNLNIPPNSSIQCKDLRSKFDSEEYLVANHTLAALRNASNFCEDGTRCSTCHIVTPYAYPQRSKILCNLVKKSPRALSSPPVET